MQQYVLGFAFNKRLDNVLLIKKEKPQWQAGKYNGIGGKVEPGEHPIDAMVREFKEEVGIPSYNSDWQYMGDLTGDDFVVKVFTTDKVDIWQYQKMESESPSIHTLAFVNMFMGGILIENLKTIIPACISRLNGNDLFRLNIRY